MDVSIIIVNYNTKELLKNCILSIIEKTIDVQYEIIVSDNGSIDGSVEMINEEFPSVRLLENNANLGFGVANNLGAKIAKGKYLFLLNSDTVLLNNAVKIFFEYAEKHLNVIVGCYLSDVNGNIVTSSGIFYSFRQVVVQFTKSVFPHLQSIYKRIKKHNYVINVVNEKEVPYVSGADFFIKKSDFDKLNGFDENFFMYSEDTDLGRRALAAGLKSYLLSEPKIIHLEGKSSKSSVKKIIIKDTSYLYSLTKIYDKNEVKKLFFYYKICSLLRFLSLSYTFKEKKEMFDNIASQIKNLRNYYE